MYLLNTMDSYPNTEEGANRLVVTSLQLHVTLVFELLDIVAPPQDSITPSRDTALPTAGIKSEFQRQSRLRHTLLALYRFPY